MTPAGTSIDVQNGWEENTHKTYIYIYMYIYILFIFYYCSFIYLFGILKSRGKMSKCFGGIISCKDCCIPSDRGCRRVRFLLVIFFYRMCFLLANFGLPNVTDSPYNRAFGVWKRLHVLL